MNDLARGRRREHDFVQEWAQRCARCLPGMNTSSNALPSVSRARTTGSKNKKSFITCRQSHRRILGCPGSSSSLRWCCITTECPQMNAVLDLATSSSLGNNFYSSSWIGPSTTELDPWQQFAAIDALNAGINLPVLAMSSSKGCVPLSPYRASHEYSNTNRTRSKTGLIIGVVVATVFFFSIVLSVLFWCHP